MITNRPKRAKSANSQGLKKRSILKRAQRNIENQENLENIIDEDIPLKNQPNLENSKKSIIKKTKNIKNKNSVKTRNLSASATNLVCNEESMNDENDEEESFKEEEKVSRVKKPLKATKIKRRRPNSVRLPKKSFTVNQDDYISNENSQNSDDDDEIESNDSGCESSSKKKIKSKPIPKKKSLKKNKKNEDKSSNNESEGEEDIKSKSNSTDDEFEKKPKEEEAAKIPLRTKKAKQNGSSSSKSKKNIKKESAKQKDSHFDESEDSLITDENKSNEKDATESQSTFNKTKEYSSDDQISSTNDECENSQRISLKSKRSESINVDSTSSDDSKDNSVLSGSFFNIFSDEIYPYKKFIYPELIITKYSSNNVNKYAKNVFYAFYGAHHETFFKIAYYITIFVNKSVLEIKSTTIDQNNSPISKYDIGEENEVEINIDGFIQYLSEKYSFSFSSESIEDVINNYVLLMRNLFGEFSYSDKIYKDCSIKYAIKADLKDSEMIPRLVIIKIKDKVQPEVNIKMKIETFDAKTNKTFVIKYKLVWLIDEEGTFVYDENGSIFSFTGDQCEKVNDISSSSKPLYACFSILVE